MSVTAVDKDPTNNTMTITAEFAAPADRVWQIWADPRQLERWWGPPSYPATVVDHDFRPGGIVNYFMTGPEGDQSHGYWRILTVDAPRQLEFEDGFADEDGAPNTDLPATTITVTLDEQDGRTRMAIRNAFPSTEAMEQMVAMGMIEGMTEAISQINGLLGVPAT